jgi:hypothetical protein
MKELCLQELNMQVAANVVNVVKRFLVMGQSRSMDVLEISHLAYTMLMVLASGLTLHHLDVTTALS